MRWVRSAWAGAVISGVVWAGGCKKQTPEWGTYKTEAAFQAGITSDFEAEKGRIGNVGREWRELSPAEYDALVERVAARRYVPGWTKGRPLVDAWGRRLHVAIKQEDLVVWSDGADGVANTPDDVKSPKEFNEKLPEGAKGVGAATGPTTASNRSAQ